MVASTSIGRRAAPPAGRPEPPLSRSELARYGRHIVLPEVGLDGQRRLKGSRALVVGAGGLGSPVALYLAAAGVGTIGLVDFDRVDASNLQRQVLFDETDVGRPKGSSARRRLRGLNSHVKVTVHPDRLTAANVLPIVRQYDVAIDGTDNFPTRYLVNDACVSAGVPDVFGSVYRFEGQASVFGRPDGPCYRCLFPEPPPADSVPSCAEGGVLGVLPGLIGTIQATEALKLLLGIGSPLVGRLLLVDAAGMGFRELEIAKDPGCPRCGAGRRTRPIVEEAELCEVPPSGTAVPLVESAVLGRELRSRTPPLVVDVREPEEYAVGHLPGSRLVPVDSIGDHRDELAGAARLVVYCATGRRSERAARWLIDHGVPNVRSLRGGITAWNAAHPSAARRRRPSRS